MKTILSKIIATALSIILAVVSIVSAGTVETTVEPVSAGSSDFTVLQSTHWIPSNQIYFSRYNTPSSSIFFGKFCDEKGNEYRVNFKDLNKTGYKTVQLPSNQKCRFMFGYDDGVSTSGSCSVGGARSYNNMGCYYKKVRIKVSAFMNNDSGYTDNFNSDGSVTIKGASYGTHTFKFGEPEKTANGSVYYSGMCVKSGSAVTAVTPNSNGEIEFLVNTRIGEDTLLKTVFNVNYVSNNGEEWITNEGNASDGYIIGLTFGDADSNCFININDATRIQSAIAESCSLNNMQEFVSDVNLDNKININDVTCIQKYLAELG